MPSFQLPPRANLVHGTSLFGYCQRLCRHCTPESSGLSMQLALAYHKDRWLTPKLQRGFGLVPRHHPSSGQGECELSEVDGRLLSNPGSVLQGMMLEDRRNHRFAYCSHSADDSPVAGACTSLPFRPLPPCGPIWRANIWVQDHLALPQPNTSSGFACTAWR